MCFFAFIKSTSYLKVSPYLCLNVESHMNTAAALQGMEFRCLSCDGKERVDVKERVKYKEIKDLLWRKQDFQSVWTLS